MKVVYRTVEEAARLHCPLEHGGCRTSACMAWAAGPALDKPNRPLHGPVIEAWMRANPVPEWPGEQAGSAAHADYRRNLEDHRRQGEAFAATLEDGGEGPEEPGWTWVAGYDDEDEHPYAFWRFTPVPRGCCGYLQMGPALARLEDLLDRRLSTSTSY